MNEEELAANKKLSEFVVRDLNADAILPYDDDCFDAIANVVSIDYLTRPFEVATEMNRVLKPGGIAILSFSNRMFWTKAVKIWTDASEWERILIAAAYLHNGRFVDISAKLVTPRDKGTPFTSNRTQRSKDEVRLVI